MSDADNELYSISEPSSTDPSAASKAASEAVCSLCSTRYTDWVSFEQGCWTLLQPLCLCHHCYLSSLPPEVDRPDITVREKQVLHDHLFILMELCDWFPSRRSNRDEMVRSLRRVLPGAGAPALAKVIHRDLKPTNIFCHGGVAKIATSASPRTWSAIAPPANPSPPDHSASVAVIGGRASATLGSSSGMLLTAVGTFLYTSPEVATGRYEKRDIFSSGWS